MVDISSQEKKINIKIQSGGVQANVGVTQDTAQYYSEKSREWATSNRIVENIDYSSKYYAEKSKESEAKAENYERSVTEKYNSFVEVSNQAEAELQTLKEYSISQINTVTSSGISDIANKTNEAITNLNTNIETATSEINNVKNNAVTQLSKEASNQIQNIEKTGFYMRDDKLYFINSEGKEEEFKSGGGASLPIGFIGQTTVPIDESLGLRRYANGTQMSIDANTEEFVATIERWSQIYPSMVASSQEEWNTIKTLSVFGHCGKYFIDREQGYIQLPLVLNAQGLGDLTNFSNIKEESLPNILGTTSLGHLASTGAFKVSSNTKSVSTYQGTTTGNSTDFDASLSSSTYKNDAPVQQEAIMYPYFIQIASGATTTIDVKNEVELNIPFFLGMSKYFDVQPNNLSWKQGGTNITNAEYPSYYELVVKVYNGTETVNGMSVKSINENYTDYDFVLDSANEQFRLPLLNGSEDISSDDKLDMELLANNTKYTAPANGWFTVQKTAGVNQGYIYIWNENNNIVSEWIATNQYYVSKVNLFVKKGDIVRVGYNLTGKTDYFGFVYAKGNGTLYYYVGETAQNANLINVPRIAENKADINASNFSNVGKTTLASFPMPSEKFINLTLGASGDTYVAPANGYVYFLKRATAIGQLVSISLSTSTGANLSAYSRAVVNNDLPRCYLPVAKGQQFSVGYTTDGTDAMTFKFYYAVGSESEAN